MKNQFLVSYSNIGYLLSQWRPQAHIFQ